MNGAHASAKRKLWRYFLRQTFYTDEGVIPETSDNFTLKLWHLKHTFFSTYNFIRVPRSKNLFCNILALSGFRDFPLFLVFWKMFLVFWGCSGFSAGVPGFLWGVPGFRWCSGFFGCSGMFRCSGVPGSATCRQLRSPFHSDQHFAAIFV